MYLIIVSHVSYFLWPLMNTLKNYQEVRMQTLYIIATFSRSIDTNCTHLIIAYSSTVMDILFLIFSFDITAYPCDFM